MTPAELRAALRTREQLRRRATALASSTHTGKVRVGRAALRFLESAGLEAFQMARVSREQEHERESG